MDGKSVGKKEKIQGYIKARTLLSRSLKDIFSKISLFMVSLSYLMTLFFVRELPKTKLFSEYDQSKLSNVVIGSETLIRYFVPVRKQNMGDCKSPVLQYAHLATRRLCK